MGKRYPNQMIFASYEFILIFFPVLLLALIVAKNLAASSKIFLILCASLIFYGWYDWRYLFLIFISATFNFYIAQAIENTRFSGSSFKHYLKFMSVFINLATLSYFKYLDFIIVTVNHVSGTSFQAYEILLPIGISFFTFQQIAYVIDVSNGEEAEYNFLHYFTFVSFFPQLIAGPIVHHRDFLSQITQKTLGIFTLPNLALGTTILTMGLVKKVLVADQIASYSTPVFNEFSNGVTLSFVETWCGAIAYTFQIYFDFSGYSDMAIGLGLILGIKLPINFMSPYRANNIIEFWRTWHITLSQFLRNYLYYPLGGNRNGPKRRFLNLIAVMLLGGLWHGAAWSFVIWGGLHGLALGICHIWKNSVRYKLRGMISWI